MICEEALDAVGVSYQQGSKAFSDLATVGCLVAVGKKPTAPGATATCYIVPDNAKVLPYLTLTHYSGKGQKKAGLSRMDRQALSAAMHFVHTWHRATSNEQRTAIVAKLVKTLSGLTSNTKELQASNH